MLRIKTQTLWPALRVPRGGEIKTFGKAKEGQCQGRDGERPLWEMGGVWEERRLYSTFWAAEERPELCGQTDSVLQGCSGSRTAERPGGGSNPLGKLKETQWASCPEGWIVPTGEEPKAAVPRGYLSWARSTMGKKAGRAGAS